jgi:hypothetical protein
MASYAQILYSQRRRCKQASMRDRWRVAYAWQRSNPTAYCVDRDEVITAALRKLFVRTRIVPGRMASGRRATYPETALFHPADGRQLSRWQF